MHTHTHRRLGRFTGERSLEFNLFARARIRAADKTRSDSNSDPESSFVGLNRCKGNKKKIKVFT